MSISPMASASAVPPGTRRGASCSRATAQSYPESRRGVRGHADARAAGRLGSAHPDLPRRSEGHGQPRFLGQVENAIAQHLPWLIGGAADLAPSTKTRMTFDGAGDFQPETTVGRNMHFGVREHAMGAALNGMALAKLRPFGSGFLIFSDYMRNPIRLSAHHGTAGRSSSSRTIRSASARTGQRTSRSSSSPGLRAVPGLITLGPCDANEVAESWRTVLRLKHQPACLILSRQALPTLDRSRLAPAVGGGARRLRAG